MKPRWQSPWLVSKFCSNKRVIRLTVAITGCCVALLLVLAATSAWTQSSVAHDGKSKPKHKVRVSDKDLATRLVADGGELIAEYGSFRLIRVDERTRRDLAKHPGVEFENANDFISLNAGAIDTTRAVVQSARKSVDNFAGKRLHLVHFAGPIKPEWEAELKASGAEIINYVPDNAYLVYGNVGAIHQLQAWAGKAPHVQWEGGYNSGHKIHPRARTIDEKGNAQKPDTDLFAIQLVDDGGANPATLQLIDQLKLGSIRQQSHVLKFLNIIVRIAPEQLPKITEQPDVISIQPYLERKRKDERQDQIIAGNLSGGVPSGTGYLNWLGTMGFTQAQFTSSGFVVDVTDSGLDNGTTTPGHFGLYVSGKTNLGSRVAYTRLVGTANSGSTLSGCDGHGTLNSHIIAGFNDVSGSFPHADSGGYRYGLGVCPFVKVGSSVIFDSDSFTNPNYNDLQSRAYHDNARVSGNSWGADTAGAYDVDAQNYDALVRDAQPSGATFSASGNQQMVIVFAAGNAGPNAQTVGSPGTAKNIICVGAAENVRSMTTVNGGNSSVGNDGCTTPDTEANSANDIASFSSRGPCSDGRRKPEIVAPGTHITGGVAQNSPAPSTNSTGSAISCFKGSGVCALPGGGTAGSANNYFPLSQQFYTVSSGTSHSTPAIAGCCALLRQYFINNSLTAPSPAMTKAWLMNSARYMNGVSANDSLWSNNQGMGEVNMGTAFDGVARIFRDEVAADKFTATGQTRTFTGVVTDTSKPLRVTIAWTDAPGNTTGNAYNNDLDLTVTIGGNTYKGNVFSGANSVTGGSADAKNNAESVFIPAGVAGNFTVTITAANINSDGVPNQAPGLDQDFALVIYNAAVANIPVLEASSVTLVHEDCPTSNSAVDPGETVTMNFGIKNTGNAATTNVVGTLQATGGVTSPSSAQTYGVLTTNGTEVTRSFSFTATGVCGSNVVATLQLQDGTQNLGTITFTIPLGASSVVLAQNFDGVAAPALPVGWTSSATGGELAWVTSTSQTDTTPNAAFVPDPATVGTSDLVSPTLAIPTSLPQLTFRHLYDLEASTTSSAGYDGGVLEIKIGSGSFTDIVTAGGTFVTGGYNRTISTGFSNPLTNRQAWSGDSGGFITTTVNLPSAAAGQNAQLRWRCGTDNSTAGTGWYVDSISISGAACCSGPSAPSIVVQPQNQTLSVGDNYTNTVSATGTVPLSYQWRTNNADVFGETNATFVRLSVTPNDALSYSVVVSNSIGAVTSAVATLTVTVPVPTIVTQPASQTVFVGSTANFFVGAGGGQPLSYQWRSNGVAIVDATQTNYTIANAQVNAAASYSVVVTNAYGSVTSSVATLTVSSGYSGVLAGWNMNGITGYGVSPMPPTTNGPNITVAGLTRGSGVATTGTAANGGWGGNGFDSSSASAAVTAGDFVTLGITGNAGYTVSFSSISTFNYRRSSSGPPNGVLQYQVGGGPFFDVTNVSYASSASPGASLSTIDLSGISSLQNVSPATSVVFRILNYGATSSGGNWYVYDVGTSAALDFAVSGSVAATVATAPSISTQPVSQTVVAGSNVTFNVTATGTAPMGYQWRKDGANLSGATDSALTRIAITSADAGTYAVVITNVAGTVTSSDAELSVIVPGQVQLLNMSANGAGIIALTWSTTPGVTYRFAQKTNLLDAQWTTIGDILASNSSLSVTDNPAAVAQRFYQLSWSTGNSSPAGFIKLLLAGNSDTYVSLPFVRPMATSAIVASVTSNTIAASGTPNWMTDQFVFSAGVQTNSHYVRFASGALEGRLYSIIGNDSNSVTVDPGNDTLASAGAGDMFVVEPYWTPATVFPNGNGVNVSPTIGNRNTEVLIPDVAGTGINLSSAKIYYFHNGIWKLVGQGNADRGTDILQPGTHLIVRHNVATNTTLVALGSVVGQKLALTFRASPSTQQDNFIGLARPVTLTLDGSQLVSSGAFAASPLPGSRTDELLVFDNSVLQHNKSAAAVYYFWNAAWRKVGSGAAVVGTNTVFTPGSAVIIRKGTNASSPIWVNTPNY